MPYLGSLKRLLRDEKGVTLVIAAVGMIGVLGLAGLGTEVGMWYFTKREIQAAADSSAFSAALARYRGESQQNYTTEADGVAATFGLVNNVAGVTVTVNNPPTSGNYTTDSNAIEVIIGQPQTAALSGLLYYAAAYWLYLTALRFVPAAVAGAYFNAIPVFGVGLAIVFLGETLTADQWAGVAAIMLSVTGSPG